LSKPNQKLQKLWSVGEFVWFAYFLLRILIFLIWHQTRHELEHNFGKGYPLGLVLLLSNELLEVELRYGIHPRQTDVIIAQIIVCHLERVIVVNHELFEFLLVFCLLDDFEQFGICNVKLDALPPEVLDYRMITLESGPILFFLFRMLSSGFI
jgi:hypothetical protein